MKESYIEFSTPWNKKLIGAVLIRWIENRRYSHVVLRYFNEAKGEWQVLEAYAGGVRIADVATFTKTNEIIRSFKLTAPEELLKAAIDKTDDSLGNGYGYLSVVGQIVGKICRALGVKSTIPFRDGRKTEFCSETIAYFLKQLAPDMSEDLKDYERMTPSEIDSMLQACLGKEMANGIKVYLN